MNDSPQLDLQPVPSELDDRCQIGLYRDIDGNTHERCFAPWAVELQNIPVQNGEFREVRVCKVHHQAMKALGFVNRTKRRLTPQGGCRGYRKHKWAGGSACSRCGKPFPTALNLPDIDPVRDQEALKFVYEYFGRTTGTFSITSVVAVMQAWRAKRDAEPFMEIKFEGENDAS